MVELNSGDVEQSTNLHRDSDMSGQPNARATLLRRDKITLLLAIAASISALAALFVLLTPVLNIVLGFMGLRFAGWSAWQAWVMEADRGLFITIALGLVAFLFTFLARHRVIRDYSVYVEAGCPSCHEQELIRVQRNRKDRALSKMGLPVRRYSCRNCTWHGLRLAGYRYKIKEKSDGSAVAEPVAPEATAEEQVLTEELAPEREGGFEADTAAEIKTYGDEVTLDHEDASTGPGEALPGYGDHAPGDNNGTVAEPAAAVQIEAVSDDSNHDAPPQQAEDQRNQESDWGSSDLESDQPEDSSVADAGTGSEAEAEDDEFARLCQEVAQSK
jgi:hypothetical protein